MSQIFISYSRTDEDIARQIAEALSNAGADIWLDVRDIPAGMNWSSAIQEGLLKCDTMIIIVSPQSMKSQNVTDEWQFFRDKKKLIIPVIWHQTEMHYQLQRLQNIVFEHHPFDQAFKQLHRELKRNGIYLDPLNDEKADTRILTENAPNRRGRLRGWMIIVALAMITLIVLILPLLYGEEYPAGTPSDTLEPLAQQSTGTLTTAITPTDTTQPTVASSNTPVPTVTIIPSRTFSSSPATISSLISSTLVPYVRVTSNAQWFSSIQQYRRTFGDIEMMYVPAGCFEMGDDPQAWDSGSYGVPEGGRQCFDRPFWIGRYEITNAQFGLPGHFDGDQRPRETVTWREARDFCASKGLRLPTEAEWEFAARGPDNLLFPWGNEFYRNRVIWNRSQDQGTADVGTEPVGVSWVGAYDMSGNVWEWTSTRYEDYPYDSMDKRETDSNRNDIRRVIRGGSWDVPLSGVLRSAARINLASPDKNDNLGFRCARDFDPSDL